VTSISGQEHLTARITRRREYQLAAIEGVGATFALAAGLIAPFPFLALAAGLAGDGLRHIKHARAANLTASRPLQLSHEVVFETRRRWRVKT
jgi:hypothetical protein